MTFSGTRQWRGGAGGGIRTHMSLRSTVCDSVAFADSATPAPYRQGTTATRGPRRRRSDRCRPRFHRSARQRSSDNQSAAERTETPHTNGSIPLPPAHPTVPLANPRPDPYRRSRGRQSTGDPYSTSWPASQQPSPTGIAWSARSAEAGACSGSSTPNAAPTDRSASVRPPPLFAPSLCCSRGAAASRPFQPVPST